MRKFDRMNFTEQSGFFHQLSHFELRDLCEKLLEEKGRDCAVTICTNNSVLYKIASEFKTKVKTTSSPEYTDYCVRLSSIFSDIEDIAKGEDRVLNSVIQAKVTSFAQLQLVVQNLFTHILVSQDSVYTNFIIQDIIPFKLIDYETMMEEVVDGDTLEYFHMLYGYFLRFDNADAFFNEFRQMMGIESDIADKVFEKYKGRQIKNLSENDMETWKPIQSHKIGISVPFAINERIRGISKKYLAEIGTEVTKTIINDINISFSVRILQIMKTIDNFEIYYTYFKTSGARTVLHKDGNWYLLFQIKSAPKYILGLNVNYFGRNDEEVLIIRCDNNEYKFTTDIEI